MTRRSFLIIGLSVVAATLIGLGFCMPRISDKEAIEAVKSLSEKLNINYRDHLLVTKKRIIQTLLLGGDVITVVLPEDKEFFAFVSRRNKEVTALYNPKSMISALKKIGIEYIETWPPFLNRNNDKVNLFINESQAKVSLLEYATKIGLPSDVQPPEFSLNKPRGLWTAKWARKYNGYPFEKDNVTISIVALNGVFYGYSKSYNGEHCSTEVIVDKNKAVNTAFKMFVDYFASDEWEKNKDKFQIESAELKIVKPDELWRRLIPFYNPSSRLAWVVVFDVKKGQETKTIGVLNKDKSVIKVDASSNKILSSEINIVP